MLFGDEIKVEDENVYSFGVENKSGVLRRKKGTKEGRREGTSSQHRLPGVHPVE